MRYLFENLVETTEIYNLIEQHAPNEDEKQYLILIVKDTIHHRVIDLILDELNEKQRELFMSDIDNSRQHLTLLKNLSVWIKDFEYKVLKRIKETEKELVELIISDAK